MDDAPQTGNPDTSVKGRREGTAEKSRLPYEKPRVTFSEPLEAVAAVCIPPTGKSTPVVCVIGSS